MRSEIKMNPRVGWRFIGAEIAIFNCVNQLMAIWNETASKLWQQLSIGANYDQLVDSLSGEYAISVKMAERDVANFLQEASTFGFIEPALVDEEVKNDNNNDGENVLLSVEMKAIEKLIPFAITLETTHACNENCIHCYMERNLPHLKLAKIKSILDEMVKENCLFVSFTGGEFFTRKDALDIIEYSSRLNFVSDVLSNGTLINHEIAEVLARNTVRRVQVSLYGATPDVHDSITQLKGSFLRTLRGIEYLKSSGIKVEIAFSLMGPNFHQRYLVKELAESLGCLMSPSHIITARNNGSKDTFSLRIDDKQLNKFLADKELASLYAGRKPFKDHQFYFGFSDILDAAPCYSGFNSCAITPSGKILPCNQFLYEVGNLNENSFSEIWHNSPELKYLRSLNLRKLKKCASCKLLPSCTRCPGLAHLEGGNLLGPSPENCRIAIANKILEERR